MRLLCPALLFLLLPPGCHGHGAVVFPPPRQAVDKNLAPWNGTVPAHPPNVESKTGWCQVVNASTGKLSGQNGQACFWFSNGCAVGCPACDGTSRGPIPGPGDGPATAPPTGIGRNKVGPNGVVCAASESTGAQPTMCDAEQRTVNVHAECGSDEDWYFYSPWRAPGAAPLLDPCGVAGGHSGGDGAFGGIYVNTSHAKLGDRGTEVLPATVPGAVWRPGQDVEVTWAIEANHAGGYAFRLCPKSGARLTEDCFQRTPLEFTGLQGLRWGGGPALGGVEIFFEGTTVDNGTTPPGSQWRKNPIPLMNCEAGLPGPCGQPAFPPKCTNHSMCTGMTDGDHTVSSMVIVDRVRIPDGLPGGDYVLGWRWDSEQSNQIWTSCSDVTIRA